MLALGALATACGPGNDTSTSEAGSGGGATVTTTAPAAGEAGTSGSTTTASPSQETTSTTAGTGSAVEGTWTASLQQLLAGGGGAASGSIRCDGDVTLTFHNGHNTVGGGGSCEMAGRRTETHYDSSADYRVEGDQIIVSGFSDNSSVTVDGVAIDGGVGPLGNGSVTWAVSGDTLTITTADPDLGSLSQTFTRA